MSDQRPDVPSFQAPEAPMATESRDGATATMAPERSNRRPLVVGAASLAALALVGGGIAVARPFGIGGSKDALTIADVVPASATAYMATNLDPGLSQKVEMVRFAMKFPSVRDGLHLSEQDDVKEKAWNALTKDHPCQGVDYATDVKPWLGDQMGAAQLPGQDKGIVVVQASDEAKARAGIAKLATCWDWKSPGVAWRDGFVVAAGSQAVADKAVADGAANPLARRAEFTEDFGKVGTQGVLSFWGTREGLQQMASSDAAHRAEGSNPVLPSSAPSAGTWAANQDFRSAAGTLRFADGNPELRMVSKANQTLKTTTSHTELDRLPATTTVAVGLSDGAELVKDNWAAITRAVEQSGQSITSLERQANMKLPDDLETLLGRDLRVAVGPVPTSLDKPADLPIAVTSKSDRAQLQGLLDRTQLSGAGITLADGVDGVQVAALNPTWARTVGAHDQGMLGDQAAFKAAYPTTDQAQSGLYVNLDAFKAQLTSQMTSAQKADVEPLQGLGISSHVEDANYGVVVARVTAK